MSGTPPFSAEFLERYRLLDILGEGGMGTVYRAVQVRLDRTVAIKVLKNLHPEWTERFRREGTTLAALRHPNIVEVLDAGIDVAASGNIPYMVTELVEGRTLEEAFAEEAWTLGRAITVIVELGRALAHAHGAGVVHRDVKPENAFLLADDSIKLSDFGLARSENARTLTQAGVIMGTPAYMAPEQVRGSGVGPAADQYALGVILYRFLAGRLPFDSRDPLKQAMARLSDDPAPLPAVEPWLTPAIRDLCNTMLAREPGDRLHSMEAVNDVLEAVRDAVSDEVLMTPLARGRRQVAARPPAPGGETLGGAVETLAPAATLGPASATETSIPGPTQVPTRSRRARTSSRSFSTIAPVPGPPPSTGRRAAGWIAGLVLFCAVLLTHRHRTTRGGSDHEPPAPSATTSIAGISPPAPSAPGLIADIELLQQELDRDDDPRTYLAPQRLVRVEKVLALLDRAAAPDLEEAIHVRLITLTRDMINEIVEDQASKVNRLEPGQVDQIYEGMRQRARRVAASPGSGGQSVQKLLGEFILAHLRVRAGLEELEYSWSYRWEYVQILNKMLVVLADREGETREGLPRWIEIAICGWDCGRHALEAAKDSEFAVATGAPVEERKQSAEVRSRADGIFVGSRLALFRVAPSLLERAREMSRHRRNDSLFKIFLALGELAGRRNLERHDRRLDSCTTQELGRRATRVLDAIDRTYLEEPRHREEVLLYTKTLGIPAPG